MNIKYKMEGHFCFKLTMILISVICMKEVQGTDLTIKVLNSTCTAFSNCNKFLMLICPKPPPLTKCNIGIYNFMVNLNRLCRKPSNFDLCLEEADSIGSIRMKFGAGNTQTYINTETTNLDNTYVALFKPNDNDKDFLTIICQLRATKSNGKITIQYTGANYRLTLLISENANKTLTATYKAPETTTNVLRVSTDYSRAFSKKSSETLYSTNLMKIISTSQSVVTPTNVLSSSRRVQFTNKVSFKPSSEEHTRGTLIIGCTVGGTLIVCCVLVLGFFLYKKNSKASSTVSPGDSENTLESLKNKIIGLSGELEKTKNKLREQEGINGEIIDKIKHQEEKLVEKKNKISDLKSKVKKKKNKIKDMKEDMKYNYVNISDIHGIIDDLEITSTSEDPNQRRTSLETIISKLRTLERNL